MVYAKKGTELDVNANLSWEAINHYPDFIVRMKSSFVLLVEAKGDDRDNSDSKQKLELGKIWESKAGSDSFGYFMVFDSNPLDNALSLDDFITRIKEL